VRNRFDGIEGIAIRLIDLEPAPSLMTALITRDLAYLSAHSNKINRGQWTKYDSRSYLGVTLQQLNKFGIVAALNNNTFTEKLGLELARDQRQVHQRCHESEPRRTLACRRRRLVVQPSQQNIGRNKCFRLRA